MYDHHLMSYHYDFLESVRLLIILIYTCIIHVHSIDDPGEMKQNVQKSTMYSYTGHCSAGVFNS